MLIDGRPLVTTASIGVSLFPRDGATMGELLRQSDTAMYQAKDRGRNNFQLFSPVMERKLKERIAIESSLRAALQARQLDVHYQPIVDIESTASWPSRRCCAGAIRRMGFVSAGPLRGGGGGDRAHRADR